jgi:GNAT superfamily N-acetyltransferase
MPSIIVRDARDTERPDALQLALGEPDMDTRQTQRICDLTESFLQRCGGEIGGLHVVDCQGRLTSACASLDLPGSVSLLMLPAWHLVRTSPRQLTDLLAFAARAAASRQRRFAQVMHPPETAEQARPALLEAGFSHLANLQYMHRSAYDPVPIQPIPETAWFTLPEIGEDLFADLIRRTYVDSLDCPGLTGVRTMQDVLASHRGAGEHDPAGWYVLRYRDQPAGVLITARTSFRTSLEVVYVGLVPRARGKGLARLCMHRAIQRARDLALAQVSLAVDAANHSACRLYNALNFTTHTTKSVWIQVFRRADAEGLFTLPSQ